jgi:leucyl aminopeptidase (aminopeptidase T)
MRIEERMKLFKDVFAPKTNEKVLFLVDIPHDNIQDSQMWKDRREMAYEWFNIFKEMGKIEGFNVKLLKYNATGLQNTPISNEIIIDVKRSNLVLAMTEYSATSTLMKICKEKDSITRCASMPGVERRMEKTAFKADYKKIKKYSIALAHMLNNSIGSEVTFSTGEKLYVDLRNRFAGSETGDCSKTGQFINFPSGEAFMAPYEAIGDEINKFGKSKTDGIAPDVQDEEYIKYLIKNNKICEVVGEGKKAEDMKIFFSKNDTRRNIAEFTIGCNPEAVVTGNILEDEKAGGLHIAYGTSTFLGGKNQSDMHEDIVYTKGCPVEATKVILIYKDESKIELIKDAKLRYDIL